MAISVVSGNDSMPYKTMYLLFIVFCMCCRVWKDKKPDHGSRKNHRLLPNIPRRESRQAQAARVTPPNTRQAQKAPIGITGMVLICMVCVWVSGILCFSPIMEGSKGIFCLICFHSLLGRISSGHCRVLTGFVGFCPDLTKQGK